MNIIEGGLCGLRFDRVFSEFVGIEEWAVNAFFISMIFGVFIFSL